MKIRLFSLAILSCLTLSACNISQGLVPSYENPTTSESSDTSTTESLPEVEESSTSEESSEEEQKMEWCDPDKVEGDYINIHYHRNSDDYNEWGLWLWEKGFQGKCYSFNGLDDYGGFAKYPLSTWSGKIVGNGLGFIVKNAGYDWISRDPDGDRFVDFAKYERQSDGGYHIYLETNDKNIYVNPEHVTVDDITKCEFVNYRTIKYEASNNVKSYKLYEDNKVILENVYTDKDIKSDSIILTSDINVEITKTYKLELTFLESNETLAENVSFKELFKTEEFNAKYFYNGNDLGAVYSKNSTSFKVWSPISSAIKLRIYDNGTPSAIDAELGSDVYQEYEMVKSSDGVFSSIVEGDLQGKYYTYVVTNGIYNEKEIIDPYAKSAGVNGLRGMIVDFNLTNPEGWENVSAIQYDRKELVVYETHIADLTSSETWNGTKENAKLFKGAYETGTTYTKNNKTVKTGFDHIKELGVNAVQIIPIFDQDNNEVDMSFNWGYNPLNYNVLEGGYSSNPHDGYTRIKEFKQLVKAYHDAGINIIMDVVYNHVAGAVGNNFDVLMPNYYYRYRDDGLLSNGSGCGNETASEMAMYRKFMMDSTAFWAKEYKLGGFRFDLMGLHDLKTMEEVVKNLKSINPNITVYGEPWTGGSSPLNKQDSAIQENGNKYVGYGQFNDQMRDALISGGMKDKSTKGWINDDILVNRTETPKIRNGIKGFTGPNFGGIKDPDKTVNYVTCHDNYTLRDRFEVAGFKDLALIKKFAMLANSIVLTSQGTTFMLAGEEFLRTKGGDNNSYQSSYEVNALDYELKVDNFDMFENYQQLIKLKTNVDGLHLNKDQCMNLNVKFSTNGNLYEYSIIDSIEHKEYKIFHRNNYKADEVFAFDLTGYKLYLSTFGDKVLNNATDVKALETLIVVKDI